MATLPMGADNLLPGWPLSRIIPSFRSGQISNVNRRGPVKAPFYLRRPHGKDEMPDDMIAKIILSKGRRSPWMIRIPIPA